MATARQIEANRNNAQRSTGPRSDAGKARARVNALKHGMRAIAFEVLPNEDPAEFQASLDAWFDDEMPTTEAQARLVRRAAVLSWKLDRAELYESAKLSQRVSEATDRAESARLERVYQAARQLLPELYSHHRSGPDGADLAQLRADVEASAEGCRWLIERWKPLLELAQKGRPWDIAQEFHATRLLGRASLERVKEEDLLDVVVANRMILYPDVPMTPQNWTDGVGQSYSRHAVMEACMRQPANRDEARSILIRAAADEITRLEEVLAVRLRDGDLGATEVKRAGRLAWFDTSMEGERLRRYQGATYRELIRTLESLARMRVEEARREREQGECEADEEPEIGSEGRECANEPNPAATTVHAETTNCANEPKSPVAMPLEGRNGANEPDFKAARDGSETRQPANDAPTARLIASQIRP